ncbi:hypothetical protein ACEPAI_2790 [Sanghuangporus weigelae]
MEDLEEAIALQRAALVLLPEGHPDRSSSLGNLAELVYVRFEKEGRADDYDESIASTSHTALHSFSSFSSCLAAAYRWVTIAQSHEHSSLIEAYRTAMSLVQRALTIRPTLSEQHKFLCSDSRHQALPLDAVSHSIERGELTQAIEFLEQGRSLLWSQMRGFRTPLEQLSGVDGALAESFENCNRRLEALITSSGAFRTQHLIDETLKQIRQLSEEQESLANDIRRIPGFETFLEASPFKTIQQAASEGPVIVLNHSKYRCDALIVLEREDDPCVCIPLDKDFYADAVDLREKLVQIRQTSGVGSSEYDEKLRRVMKTLWERVVSKVVSRLKELGINSGSRIWWCPASVLSALPFHAAGPYEGADGRARYLLDDYISSCTSTLTPLINARTGAQNGGERMLFVGDTKLPSAGKERDAINRIRRFKQLLGDRATPEAVLELPQGAQWVHFACHGYLAKEPFNFHFSSFQAAGSRYSASRVPIFQMRSSHFFQLAIQSVVGTMWQLLDNDGPLLARTVYGRLMRDLEEGEIRFKRAAAAVRQAALNLRENGDEDPDTGLIMTERWVNLVHMGA